MAQRAGCVHQPTSPKSAIDLRLEAVVIPVADVDRAKTFYVDLGWRLDADFPFDNGFRVVQLTPPGSPCSVQFGTKITSAAPGSAEGLYLIVSDMEAARDELLARAPRSARSSTRPAPAASSRPTPSDRRARAGRRSRELQLVRHVQRPRRQPLAAPGGHHAAARPGRLRGDVVRVRVGPGAGAAPARRPRRARDPQRRAYDENWPDWYAEYMVAEQAGTELPT